MRAVSGWADVVDSFMCASCHDRFDDDEMEKDTAPPSKRPRVCGSPHSLDALVAGGDLLVHNVRGAIVATDPSSLVFPGVGSSLWVAARVLADYCHHCVSLRPGSRVLELGAGCGAVGLSLAVAGHELTLTDESHLLPLLQFNAMRNSVNGRPASVAALRWGDAAHLSALIEGLRANEEDGDGEVSAWDLILASDVAYDDEQHANLLDSLAFLARQRRRVPRKRVAAQLLSGGGGVRLQLGVLGLAGTRVGGSNAHVGGGGPAALDDCDAGDDEASRHHSHHSIEAVTYVTCVTCVTLSTTRAIMRRVSRPLRLTQP